MHRLDEHTSVSRVHFRGNAVAEVEHMTGALAVAGENPFHFIADRLRVGIQHGGVHIALQRDFGADPGTGHADIHGPVQTDTISATLGNAFQPQAAVLGEYNHRDAAPVMLTNQTADDLAHIGQGKHLIGIGRQVATPGVKDLHRLSA